MLPPDARAREAILAAQLVERPVEELDLTALARATERFSGADLVHLVDAAAELALEASSESGKLRPIVQTDFTTALQDVRDTTRDWLAIEMLPDGHDKFEEHGNIALARGDWALAESKFRSVLADGSTCCCSWAGFGIALFELGRSDESAACERSVIEHNWSCSCVTATSLRRRLG